MYEIDKKLKQREKREILLWSALLERDKWEQK